MNNTLMTAALFVLVGSGGVFVGSLMTDGDAGAGPIAPRTVDLDGKDIEALRNELSALRDRVEDLAASKQTVVTEGLGQKRLRDELAAIKEQIAALQSQNPSEVVAQNVLDRLAADEERKLNEMRARKEESDTAKRRARAARRAQDFAKTLQLTSGQTENLTTAIEERMANERGLWGTIKDGSQSPADQLRALTLLRESGERFGLVTQGILSSGQFEQFQAMPPRQTGLWHSGEFLNGLEARIRNGGGTGK